MPLLTPSYLQAVAIRAAAGTGPQTFAFPSSLTAGSLILLIAGLTSTTGETLHIGTPSGGPTWSTPLSARVPSAGEWAPNIAVAWTHNVSAGASPTFSVPFLVWNGSALVPQTTNIKVSGWAVEVGNVPTSAAIDPAQVKFATTGTGATSTVTPSTGALSQTEHRLFAAGTGYFGIPGTPTGGVTYTVPSTPAGALVQNGESPGYIGFVVGHGALSGSAAAQTATITHDAGAGAAAVIVPVKGRDSGAKQYQVELPATGAQALPIGSTNLVAYVWRNVNWYAALPEVYTLAAPTIVAKPGDATRNLLRFPADPAALVTDAVTVIVMQASSGKRAGPGAGAVVTT